jgi:hypothetical protein
VRTVELADAFVWMPAATDGAPSPVVSYLPERTDLEPLSEQYRRWYRDAADVCLYAARGRPAVLFVVDRLAGGRWTSKVAWILSGGHDRSLVGHRIYTTRAPGTLDLRRPAYAHGLYFGSRPGPRRPDVVPFGPKLWKRGLGLGAARDAARFVADLEDGRGGVLNPFCGWGTLLAAAEEAGLDAAGCDLDPEAVAVACELSLPTRPLEAV